MTGKDGWFDLDVRIKSEHDGAGGAACALRDVRASLSMTGKGGLFMTAGKDI